MGKKRKAETVDELLDRPFCYYCERDFDDLKILISHQKAKHFKCSLCNRRLNTAGGLQVHLQQVHKENLQIVDNALPGRGDTMIEIFGMEGMPDDIKSNHRQRVIKDYYEKIEDHRRKTGNPPAGSGVQKTKYQKLTMDFDIKTRLENKLSGKENAGSVNGNADDSPTTTPVPMDASAFAPPPGMPPGVTPLGTISQNTQDPRIRGPPPTSSKPSVSAADIDEMVGKAAAPQDEAKPKEKKGKQTKLVYSDNEISPEEKMAGMRRYVFKRSMVEEDSVMGNVNDAPSVANPARGQDDVMDAQAN